MVSVSTVFFATYLRNFSPPLAHTQKHIYTETVSKSWTSSTPNSHTCIIKHNSSNVTCVLCELYVCCRGCMVVWLPLSFAWGNFSVLAVGVWAIAQRDSIDAVLMVSICLYSFTHAAILISCDTYRSLSIGTAMHIRANLFVCGI